MIKTFLLFPISFPLNVFSLLTNVGYLSKTDDDKECELGDIRNHRNKTVARACAVA